MHGVQDNYIKGRKRSPRKQDKHQAFVIYNISPFVLYTKKAVKLKSARSYLYKKLKKTIVQLLKNLVSKTYNVTTIIESFRQVFLAKM